MRASILEMDPDGKNQKHFARGLRNAVGSALGRRIKLFATNMGSDHLGDHKPADTMYHDQRRDELRLALLLPVRPGALSRIRSSTPAERN